MFKGSNNPSWKAKRERANQNNFIGRANDLSAFRNSLTNSESDAMIFSISGQGGVGKTTLLQQFCRITKELEQVVAYLDEGSQINPVTDVPESLYRLANSLEQQGGKFKRFYERYKTYRQKKQELEADPDAPNGIVAGISKFGTKTLLSGVKAIPAVGEAMDGLIDIESTADKVGDLASYAWTKFRNKDEVKLVLEPEEVLTPLWLEGVNQIATEKTVVLLLDTFEQTGKFLDNWLRALLEERYGVLTPDFRLCIAGRDPLNRNLWANLEQFIARSPLEPFTEDEARQYLNRKGITSEDVIAEILRLAGDESGGSLPLLVSMMAQSAPTSPYAVVDCCESAVERFLKWETDENKRQIACNASFPRLLNADVVEYICGDQLNWNWLKACPFVIEHPEGWQYHSIVREQMMRYQRKESPQKWQELHVKLTSFYDLKRQNKLETTDAPLPKNKTVQRDCFEFLYHGLCVYPSAEILGIALNGWLRILEHEHGHELQQKWSEAIRMAGISTDSEDLKNWGQKLHNVSQSLEETYSSNILEVFSELSKEPLLENECRAIALASQVTIPFHYTFSKYTNTISALEKERIPDVSKEIEILNQAIRLAPKKCDYFIYRGMLYFLVRNWDNASSDLHQALNLAQTYNNDLKESIQKLIETYFKTEKTFIELEKSSKKRYELENKIEKQIIELITKSESVQNFPELLSQVFESGEKVQITVEDVPNHLESLPQRKREFYKIYCLPKMLIIAEDQLGQDHPTTQTIRSWLNSLS